MTLTKEELLHLQNLCCISLSEKEQQKFLHQLENIIGFLGTMKSTSHASATQDHLLTPIPGVRTSEDTQALLKNTTHETINNCIVIKSVLDS